ncbi:hypothetical protein MMC20_005758 [Loxospora ochrophaea]|nr:hypothetical protein [Loxospora ochrophaea]
MDSIPKDNSASRLLRLPLEVRCIIWDFLIPFVSFLIAARQDISEIYAFLWTVYRGHDIEKLVLPYSRRRLGRKSIAFAWSLEHWYLQTKKIFNPQQPLLMAYNLLFICKELHSEIKQSIDRKSHFTWDCSRTLKRCRVSKPLERAMYLFKRSFWAPIPQIITCRVKNLSILSLNPSIATQPNEYKFAYEYPLRQLTIGVKNDDGKEPDLGLYCLDAKWLKPLLLVHEDKKGHPSYMQLRLILQDETIKAGKDAKVNEHIDKFMADLRALGIVCTQEDKPMLFIGRA